MAKLRNEEYWREIEDQKAFKGPESTLCWDWLQKLQASAKLSAVSMIQLGALLNNVYEVGVLHGKEEASEGNRTFPEYDHETRNS